MLRQLFKPCRYRGIDGMLLIAIAILILWNMNTVYNKTKGGISKTTKGTVSSERNVHTAEQSKHSKPDVTSFTSVSNILKKQPDVNGKQYGDNLKYVLNSPGLCKRRAPVDDVTLVILVTTSVSSFKSRQHWRDSVEIRKHGKVRVLFVVEKPDNETLEIKLKKEHKSFGDVISMNFDKGNNMADSLRCVSGLRWIRDYCPQTGYVLRVGVNTLVMVANVLEYLDSLPPGEKENLYSGGTIHRNAIPKRSGEWAVTLEEWPGANYPDYVHNVAIFLSGKVASVMADISLKVRLFKFTDVYFGILAAQAQERIFALEANDAFRALAHTDVKDEFSDYCKMKKYLYIFAGEDRDMEKGWDVLKQRNELLCPAH